MEAGIRGLCERQEREVRKIVGEPGKEEKERRAWELTASLLQTEG